MNCNSKINNDKNCNIIIQEPEYDQNYVYVYILQLNKTTGIINDVFIKTNNEDQIIFKYNADGFYTLATLKVPKGRGAGEYYYDEGKFYHYFSEIELATLIELNTNTTNLELTYEYYVQTCRLRKCFVNICQQIFDQAASLNCNKSNVDSELIYKRDLIWSALNVIKYLDEQEQYEEAERLIERIMGCNGLCNNYCENESQNSCNCGCV